MTRYAIGGFVIASELPLVEGHEASDSGTPLCFVRVASQPLPALAGHPLFEWRNDDGRVWIACAKHCGGYTVRFPGLAEFSVSADGRAIAVFAVDGTPVNTIRHLFLDQVFPLTLPLHGELALHGSAVETPDGAVAFVGTTGSGKSTLTASFASAGFRPLTDDCLVVRASGDHAVAIPSYPGVRLWPDALESLAIDDPAASDVAHYSDKRRVLAVTTRNDDRPVLLRRIFVLTPDEEATDAIRIAAPSRRDAMIDLVKHAFRIDREDPGALTAELDRVDRVCRVSSLRYLTYPRTFESLAEVRSAVLADIQHA